jgi:hypothetical protein
MLWQAAANAASVAGVGGSSIAGGDGAICEGCGYSCELPDTTAVLMSLLALYPGLRKLEVYTKVRWLQAAGLMIGLTAIRCCIVSAA